MRTDRIVTLRDLQLNNEAACGDFSAVAELLERWVEPPTSSEALMESDVESTMRLWTEVNAMIAAAADRSAPPRPRPVRGRTH